MKPRKGQKRAIFQSLILGGGSRVSIYFVQEGGSRREKVEVVFGLGQMGQLFRSYKPKHIFGSVAIFVQTRHVAPFT